MFRRPLRALILGAIALAVLNGEAETVAGGGRAEYVGSFKWEMQDKYFGGFSGIEMADDGQSFVAITDRAHIARGRIERRDGLITAIRPGPLVQLHDNKGRPLSGEDVDSEGLALAPDGGVFVSFELNVRVAHYARDDGPSRLLPRPREFEGLGNSALEALAIDGQGRIYTMPESTGRSSLLFPVWRWDGKAWTQPFAIPRRGDFLAVGADFGPDGRLYLLERDFTYVLGFRTRIRAFSFRGDAIASEEEVLSTRTGTHDNLEGLSAWRDASGAIRLTMISDDNFNSFQTTEIVEYRIR